VFFVRKLGRRGVDRNGFGTKPGNSNRVEIVEFRIYLNRADNYSKMKGQKYSISAASGRRFGGEERKKMCSWRREGEGGGDQR
jgi:hypothetical protein